MFDYLKKDFVHSAGCTREAFEGLLADTTVRENCAKIEHIMNSIPADASDEELKEWKKRIGQYKSGCREKGIAPLPSWCFHASFKNNYRTNDNAIPSGLCSIDLDHIQEPREFFERLREKALEQHLALAFVSPSTRGLKMVFPVPEGCLSMEEAQDRIVSHLGVEAYFDHDTFDLARAAFAVPASYILYRNDEELFADREVNAEFEKIPTFSKDEQEMMIEHKALQKAHEHFVDGISMQQMIEHLSMKYCGQTEPDITHRNTTLYRVAKVMRVACQDDFEQLTQVMPLWGQSQTEWNATLRSATKREISQSSMREYEEMMAQLKREKAVSEGLDTWRLPEPPRDLPPVFREYARITPRDLRAAQLLSLLPTLGFYGTMAKANYADAGEEEDMRTPSFIVVVSAPPASGKNHITHTFRELTEPIRLQELPLLDELNRYNQDKKGKNPPAQPIRLMPEKLSMTSLSVQLENARGMHLLQFTPEIDTLKSSNGSGAWNDLSTVFRKALDNDPIGQIYMSAESHCCNVNVYLNQLIEAQPETMKKFFNRDNVINGLVSRVIIVELPDNTGCRKLKVKRMSEFERNNVQRVLEYLQTIGVETQPSEYDEDGNLLKPAVMDRQLLKIPRCRKALQRWGRMHQDHYLQTQENPAEDHFFRRAAMLGFHAAMVAYMCSNCKETKEVIDFALWVAEFTLQSQLLHYGNIYNSIHQKRQNDHTDNVVRLAEVSRFNLLEALPEEFGAEDMVRIMRANGKNMSNPHKKIKCWKNAGFVVEVPTNTQIKRWRKITPSGEAELNEVA